MSKPKVKFERGDQVQIASYSRIYKITKVDRVYARVYIKRLAEWYPYSMLTIYKKNKRHRFVLWVAIKLAKLKELLSVKTFYNPLKNDYSYELAAISAEKALHEMKKDIILEQVDKYISSGTVEDYKSVQKSIKDLDNI